MNSRTAALPANWTTDLAILELAGARIARRDDHLIVRTPQNRWAHWANFLLVTDPATVSDADRWTAAFAEEFPDAGWVAVGLPTTPDATGWARHGIDIQPLDTLAAMAAPHETPPVPGYEIRPFTPDDWAHDVERAIAENAATRAQDPAEFAAFVTAQARQRRRLMDRGVAAWFGAFSKSRLLADLGIVLCGHRARYQDVSTDPEHRRRGLASHLLGVAGQWAARRGCAEWVIVTEPTNAAGRVYRAAGFRAVPGGAEAYRKPPPAAVSPAL
ncbi:GNAT family N-acetyltransferase [Propionicicella superfundia]|uniref:GNAT family N-acetyltransferase n=1 Tax=Propionicicella superfundia TaxID=348582 RepID=UPI0004109942|nr:GNAT family N-acetyltransferase [Propionicicella superfundia]